MTEQHIPEVPRDDQFVDFEGAVIVLHAMGFKKQNVRKVRRLADEGKLPFFKCFKERYILVRVLKERFMRLQNDAIRGVLRNVVPISARF